MRKQIAAALCLAVLGATALSSLAIAQQKTAKGNSDRQIYSSIKDIMESIVDPSADALWGAVGSVVDNDGIHDLVPKTPQEWTDLRHAAVRMIEGGNLLMMPGREAAPAGSKSEAEGVELEPPEITVLVKKNRKSFNAFAEALRGLGWDALRATDAKDAASLMDVGARMESVCEGCHQTFWYPPKQNVSAGGSKR
jgi:hypothetical protein